MRKTLLFSIALSSAVALAGTAWAADRGRDGELRLLYWQAPSTMMPFLSGGTKELEASSVVIEPLARYDNDGKMHAWLAEEIPTVANGGVAEDLKSITWKIKRGIKWSDGSELTSADAVFTYEYCSHPDTGCTSSNYFNDIVSVDAVDPHTIRINFSVAKPFPYAPFVGYNAPIIQKAQFDGCIGAKAQECTEQNFNPIGTGPFKVVDFKPNDVIVFEANELYREEGKPAFSSLLFKGGGDATSAARSVLETSEMHYAWNLQVEPEILAKMAEAGKGTIIAGFGTSVERLMVNFTNPDPNLGDDRAEYLGGNNNRNPHPFLSDYAVRRALSLAIDRQILVDAGYGSAGKIGCNVLPAPAIYASDANDECKTQNVDEANRILDEAGWVRGSDGVRAKNGVRLSILYQTSTNSVRQGTQAFIKEMWKAIGVETELRNLSASVFFGGDPASPDTYQKFYADIEMYTNNFSGTDPETYMANWTCKQVSRRANTWGGGNMPRWCNPDYDALSTEMSKTADLDDRIRLAKAMNDMLMQDYAMIPLVHRGGVSAFSNVIEGPRGNEWDSELWNIADWHLK
ncbi:MAG: peptide ABC transporter [Acidiferrobacteraceae bacterium]|jgi:peptide/nickel transport system substrate-binding protein|nr:peptide ABC transporter [Acidiferrobacteraceae bacterium]MDP6854435.1 peptide ABC transporter substrate-binding protein [Arenicellales bacterium]MDP6948445.1 peptide ABC transporter substrate-binding protein [Arenicellales bacterium]HCY13311.1 peptide ABC transporter [Gammaproteobacteria bacterium]|tara:strand:- start:2151 stop:3869 length:1719 start_codon:yes stop_codon:yes gene_type:complete